MKPAQLIAISLTALLFAAGTLAHAGEIYVIANPNVTLTSKDIREIYVGEMEFSGDVHLSPIDNSAIRAEFVTKALSMMPERYKSLWIKKTFRDAVTPPAVRATDAAVLAFVRRTRGAVGYISSAPNDNLVNVVAKY